MMATLYVAFRLIVVVVNELLLQIYEYLDAGASGFLIGETLMRGDDPGVELGRLLQCS